MSGLFKLDVYELCPQMFAMFTYPLFVSKFEKNCKKLASRRLYHKTFYNHNPLA